MTAPLDLDLLESQVRAALDADDIAALRDLVARIYPPDLADIIERLDDEDQQRVFSLLERQQAADVLDEASIDTARELIGQMPANRLPIFWKNSIATMPPLFSPKTFQSVSTHCGRRWRRRKQPMFVNCSAIRRRAPVVS